jgi:hypothetical protein
MCKIKIKTHKAEPGRQSCGITGNGSVNISGTRRKSKTTRESYMKEREIMSWPKISKKSSSISGWMQMIIPR